jgi:hypothetical protein
VQTTTTIGLDIAKSVFQVHRIDVGGQVVIRRHLKRRYVLTFFEKLAPCLIGIEALTALTGRTHGCSDQYCDLKILLANPEPSTHGPLQTISEAPANVGF